MFERILYPLAVGAAIIACGGSLRYVITGAIAAALLAVAAHEYGS